MNAVVAAQAFITKSRHVDAMISSLHMHADSLRPGEAQKVHQEQALIEQAAERVRGSPVARPVPKAAAAHVVASGIPGQTRLVGDAADGRRNAREAVPLRRRDGAEARLAPGQPPWGPERANIDNPSYEQVLQQQRVYCRMLDEQAGAKDQERRRRREEEDLTNRTTGTSFESQHHRWGFEEGPSKSRERAIRKELLTTIANQQCEAFEQAKAQREVEALWAERAEQRMVWDWHVNQLESKRAQKQLAGHWKEAAEDKRRQQEASREAKLREEREQMHVVTSGMVQRRPMRRPKQLCQLRVAQAKREQREGRAA